MSAQLRRSLRPSRPAVPRPFAIGVAVIAVVAGFIAWKVTFKSDRNPAPLSDSSIVGRDSSKDGPVRSVQQVAIADLLARARTEAKGWNPQAQLVWLKASPVRAGWVDVQSGGQLIATFGAPQGHGFSNLSQLGDGQLLVTVTGDKISSSSKSASEHRFFHTDRATLDPACTGYAAFQNLNRAKDLEDVGMTLSYGTSRKHDKPVWLARTQEELIALDGNSCAILMR